MRLHPLGAALVAALSLSAAGTASAHPDSQLAGADSASRFGTVRLIGHGPSDGVSAPIAMSPNVRALFSYPGVRAISGAFSHTGSFFYVSGLDSIHVFDTTNPKLPVPVGVLPNILFENEAMTYGERRKPDGSLERFLMVGNDLYQASVDRKAGVGVGNIGGGEVIVVDVTDPANPHVRSRVDVSESTHTVHCLSLACEYVYTSGGGGEFSVVDARNLDAPRNAGMRKSPGAGHFWDVDSAGIAWNTGDDAAAAFDITDPENPRLVTTTNAKGSQSPWNDFILHNSKRPNATAFKDGQEPSLANGNVLLVSEEDYLDTNCSSAGSFQTWHVTSDDRTGAVEPLDRITASEAGGGLTTPRGGFCSAHWFDVHQSGVAAVGFYQAGLRFIDVRNARDIKQHGYMTAGASEVWDAYFVPERDAAGRDTGRKTNVVYSVDALRGLDVVEVDLPSAAAFPAGDTIKKAKQRR